MTLVLDAGGLIGVDRADRQVGVLLLAANREDVSVRTSGAVVAQVWRDGRLQANLARVLGGIDVVPLDDSAGRRVGRLLAATGTSDVVDGHVASLVESGDILITSDVDDLARLLHSRRVDATIQRI